MESRLEAERAKHGAAAKPPTDSKGVLDELRALVLGMEARTAEASYFLPPYDARACASTTDRLKHDLAAAADALAPRKTFSFFSLLRGGFATLSEACWEGDTSTRVFVL